MQEIVQSVPIAELLPGGQFTERWHSWLAKERIVPKVFTRVTSFIELAKIVQTGHAAAVLPDMAEVDFDPKRYAHRSIPALRKRTLVLFANALRICSNSTRALPRAERIFANRGTRSQPMMLPCEPSSHTDPSTIPTRCPPC
jgi:hypothetical protein